MIAEYYTWIKAIHIMAMVTWMAGLFYLPRLYVYHAYEKPGSATSETFKIMEEKLLRYIMNPSMIITWVGGILLILAVDMDWTQGWWHAKLLFVLLMSGFHGWCAYQRKVFLRDENSKGHKYFRVANEVPTVLFVVIIIMVVVQPL